MICRRAEKELHLERQSEPGLVLVRHDLRSGDDNWILPRWLRDLAGGNSAQAASPAVMRDEGRMISLVPLADTSDESAGGQR